MKEPSQQSALAKSAISLGIESSLAATAGLLTGGPLGAVIGAALPPLTQGLKLLFGRVVEVEEAALLASSMSPTQLRERILEEERLFSLGQIVFDGAQRASTPEKRTYLGRLLGKSASHAVVDLDEVLIFAQVLIELEEPHMRALKAMETFESGVVPYEQGNFSGIPEGEIDRECFGLGRMLRPVLLRLEGHNLIENPEGSTYDGHRRYSWRLTEFGSEFLHMLRSE